MKSNNKKRLDTVNSYNPPSSAGNEKIDSENSQVKWWKTKRTRYTAAGVGAAFFIGFLFWLFLLHPYVSTDDARIDADIIRVANQGVGGEIRSVYVNEGDWVKKGEILVELDHRIAEAQLARARARAKFTAIELQRAENLAAQKGITLQQLDKARSEAVIAEADSRLAEIALEHTYLRSPVNGVVVQKVAKVGNILEMNQTAITVVDIDHAWVSANIEETDVGHVKAGQKVDISVDEGGSLTGKVIEVRHAAAAVFALIPSDNSAGNFIKLVQRIPIKIQLDPHPGKVFRVGQSVVIKVRVR